jgi:Leucine-rich repeat (LRR) protein
MPNPQEIAKERIAEWKRDPYWRRDRDFLLGREVQKWIRFDREPIPIDVEEYGARTKVLNLNALGLSEILASLRTVRNLEVLLISDNKIEVLPRWIGELSELKAIGADRNRLRKLPREIGRLRELVVLTLADNDLEVLPEEILGLPLHLLDLQGNPKLGSCHNGLCIAAQPGDERKGVRLRLDGS